MIVKKEQMNKQIGKYAKCCGNIGVVVPFLDDFNRMFILIDDRINM